MNIDILQIYGVLFFIYVCECVWLVFLTGKHTPEIIRFILGLEAAVFPSYALTVIFEGRYVAYPIDIAVMSALLLTTLIVGLLIRHINLLQTGKGLGKCWSNKNTTASTCSTNFAGHHD